MEGGDLKALIATLNAPCRQSLEDSAASCVQRGHFTIELEHFLLELLDRRRTDLHAILGHYGIDHVALADELRAAVGTFKTGNTKVPNFSAQLSAVLREAWMVSSIQLGAAKVRSGGIALAIRTVEGVRDVMLRSAPSLRRIEPDRLKADLVKLTQNTDESGEAAPRATPTRPAAPVRPAAPAPAPHVQTARVDTPALDRYTVDLVQRARDGRIDPIVGRAAEIRQLVDVLTRRRQNNPILVGEAGVGKTAVAEGLARRIARGDVPPSLRAVSLRMLDLALLQAGAGVQGEFERRLKAVIADVDAALEPIVLFIDEAHMLIGGSGQTDAANLLKPALARGELRTIAATTWAEYKRVFETDAALARRFQLVRIDEPDAETAVAMVRALVPRLEAHHSVRVLDEAVRDAVYLSQRYITGRRLPDKAVGVVDTACARVGLGQRATPAEVEDATRRVERLNAEEQQLASEADVSDHSARLEHVRGELARARDAEAEARRRWSEERAIVDAMLGLEQRLDTRDPDDDDVRQELAAARESLLAVQGDLPMVPLEVDGRVVASVVAGWTGVPVGRVLRDRVHAVLELEKRLGERIIGQPGALAALARRMRTARAGLDDPSKPVGVFLFVGPSGVGKTETAWALAEALYGGESNLVVVNMSEYQEAHSVSQLKGAPPGYAGFGRGGVLTEAVRRRPYSVVLLDEAEKAHLDVLQLFHQVFDKGVLEDGEGIPVDFRNTVILLTTNAPENDLERSFPRSLLTRLEVVPFKPLGDDELKRIVELKLNEIQARFQAEHEVPLSYTQAVVDGIVGLVERDTGGARQIDRVLRQRLLPGLSTTVLQRLARGLSIEALCVTWITDDFGYLRADEVEDAIEAPAGLQRLFGGLRGWFGRRDEW